MVHMKIIKTIVNKFVEILLEILGFILLFIYGFINVCIVYWLCPFVVIFFFVLGYSISGYFNIGAILILLYLFYKMIF